MPRNPHPVHSSPLLRGAVAGALALLLAACTTQGRLTYQEFRASNDYDTLNAAMEDLKYKAREGPFYWPWPSLQQQVSAVNNLRWIAAYADDEGKKEMALRTLVFIKAFNTDRAVRPLAQSRIETIWGDAQAPLYQKIAILEAERDIVLGTLGYGYGKKETLRPAKPGKREDTALALLERLQDPATNPYLQARIFEALEQILRNPPLPDASLEKDQVDWQNELRKELLALLRQSDKDIVKNPNRGAEKWPSDLRRALLNLVSTGRSEGTPMPAPIRALLQKRAESPDTPEAAKGFYDSALKRDEAQCQPTDAAANPPPTPTATPAPDAAANAKPSEACSASLSAPPLEELLRNQVSNDDLFRLLDTSLRKSRGAQGVAIIPSSILSFSAPGAESTPEQLRERRAIVFNGVLRALRDGALLRSRALENELLAGLKDSADDLSQLYPWLQIAALAQPSFKAQSISGTALVAYLAEQARTEDIHRRRLYLAAWLRLIDPQSEAAKKPLEDFKALPGLDILTRHALEVVTAPPPPPPPAAEPPKDASKDAPKDAAKENPPQAVPTSAEPAKPTESPSKP